MGLTLVEDVFLHEPNVTIDGTRCSVNEGPSLGIVAGQATTRVTETSDCYCTVCIRKRIGVVGALLRNGIPTYPMMTQKSGIPYQTNDFFYPYFWPGVSCRKQKFVDY